MIKFPQSSACSIELIEYSDCSPIFFTRRTLSNKIMITGIRQNPTCDKEKAANRDS